MPEAAEIVVFDMSGKSIGNSAEPLAKRIGVDTKSETEPDPMVGQMNDRAESMARAIEQEVRAVLPPDPTLSVTAELHFHQGSLVMIGTVAVVSWVGSVALETVRTELAALIKIAVQRVLAAAVRQVDRAGAQVTMECSVTPRPRSSPPGAVPAASLAPAATQPGLNWRDFVLIFLLVAVLLLLIDSLFDATFRGAMATAPPAAPASPAASARP
jgi:hypothetical protein